MQFKVSSSLLLEHLDRISGVVTKKPVVPILENFLFILEKNLLSVIASDLEILVKTQLEVDCQDSASYCVPSFELLEGLHNCSEQPLTFVFNAETMSLKVQHSTGYFEIPCENSKDYPEPAKLSADSKSFSVPLDIMLAGINHTINSTTKDELRPVLAGVHFGFYSDKMRVVATDGLQLPYYTNYKVKHPEIEGSATFTIRKKPVSIIKKMLKDSDDKLVLSYDSQHVFLDINYSDETKGGTIVYKDQVIVRLISQEYPNYEKIIPRDEQYFKATFDLKALLQVLNRSVNFADANHCICMKFSQNSDTMTLYSADMVTGRKSEDKLPVRYEGQDFKIGLNGILLKNLLGVLSSKDAVFLMTQADKSIRIYPDPVVEGEEPFALLQPISIPDDENSEFEA